MAARCVQAPRRPVTLRDFLELGCDSSSDGFRSYPRRLPGLVPDADAALQQQQQQAPPPAPRAEAAPAQLLRRSPSRSPSSLSLSLFSLPGPGALARISSLSRSFSRRIKEGFWRRRDVEGDDDEEEDAYFDDRDSCGFPSPLVSSCSASDSDEAEYDYAAESEADVTMTTTEETPASERDKATASTSSSSSSSSSSSNSADHDRTDAAADGKKMQAEADGDSMVGRKKLMGDSMVEDKQQLSPVSVLDFPFDDDDGDEGSDAGTCSSPAFEFQRCTPPPDLHETKHQAQLLHKIRLYDGGVAQGIDPVDLDARFTAATSESGDSADASTRHATTTSSSSTDSSSSSSSAATTAPRHEHDDDEAAEHQSAERSPSPTPDHHEQAEPDDEYRLLARLLEHDAAAAACLDDEVSRMLILDFFAEGADRLIRSLAADAVVGGSRPLDDDRSEALLVGAAAEWLRGTGPRWGIGDVVHSGKAALDDMERSRRWMCVGEEEREVGADVEGAVIDALVDELVTELVLPWWPRGDMMVVDASELQCVLVN